MGLGIVATITVVDVLALVSVVPPSRTVLVEANPEPVMVMVCGLAAVLTVTLLMVCAPANGPVKRQTKASAIFFNNWNFVMVVLQGFF
jgi:hypothetical protein